MIGNRNSLYHYGINSNVAVESRYTSTSHNVQQHSRGVRNHELQINAILQICSIIMNHDQCLTLEVHS